MPDTVLFMKDATVLSVGGTDFLGYAKSARATFENKEADHSGPADAWNYQTVVRTGVTIVIDSFMPTTGSTAAALVMAKANVAVTADTFDGQTLAGTFTPVSASAEGSDEAGSESLTLKSYGAVTLT